MTIRPAKPRDLPVLLDIFKAAKAFMVRTGNPHQWREGYPGSALMEEEIARGVCYLVEEAGEAVGTFCAIPGEEPTYKVIYDGAWPSDAPYLTIHRLASNGKAGGVAAACFAFCAAKGLDLRIDTHADNHVMQDLLARNGFTHCGRILLANGSPRLAYHRPARKSE